MIRVSGLRSNSGVGARSAASGGKKIVEAEDFPAIRSRGKEAKKGALAFHFEKEIAWDDFRRGVFPLAI